MTKFLDIDIKNITEEYKNTIISLDKTYSFDEYFSTLYYCFKNEYNLLIGKTNIKDIDENKPKGIYYKMNNRLVFISWEYLEKMNKFIAKKHKTKTKFFIKTNSFYNIFFLKFIDSNMKLYNKKGENLVGISKSLFGIYDTFNEQIYKCTYSLYFSYGLNKFLLYRVLLRDSSVVGKLMDDFKFKKRTLIYKDKEIPFPKSFIHFKKRIFGIKKKEIKVKIDNIIDRDFNKHFEKYDYFCKMYRNENIYFLKVKHFINKSILAKLYTFLVAKFPLIDGDNNYVLVDPNNIDKIKSYFSMYLITKNNDKLLVLHFNQFLSGYIDLIINGIDEFFRKLSKNNIITTGQYKFNYNNKDSYIHIISEIYYLIVIIIFKLPRIVNNIQFNSSEEKYIQANYKFKKTEIKKLQKNKTFTEYSSYLKEILIKCLSVFMNNYYLFIHNGEYIDIIPIQNGMSNTTIKSYLERSHKAQFAKSFLVSYLSNFFIKLNNKKLEMPIIFLNLTKITNTSIKIDKVYGHNSNKNIPIIINVIYSKNQLLINISYKSRHEKIKYIFNQVLEEILG